MQRSLPLYVKRTRAKGRAYYYFRTGRFGPSGAEIMARLPDVDDAGFWDAYGAYMSARKRRATVKAEMTVTEMAALYEISPHFRSRSDGTQRIYGLYLKQFCALFPTAPAQQIRREWIVKMIDKRAETPGAANSLLRTVAALYAWGRKRGHVTADPCKDIAPLPIGEHEPWPDATLAAGLTAKDARIRLAVHLLYFTALRIEDVVRLRWSNVQGAGIVVTPQKTKRTRGEMTIPLHPELAAELARHPRTAMTILAQANGKPLHQHTLRTGLQAFAVKAGAKVVPHGLRKNAVIALLEAGCTVAETAAISGQSLKQVEHYSKRRGQERLATAAILKWGNNVHSGS